MSAIPSGWKVIDSATGASIMRAASRSSNGLLLCGDADWSQRCEGLCTLHVSVRDPDLPSPPLDPALVSNGKLVLDVDYRSGQAGGLVTVDVPAGGMLTLGAADVVSVSARFEATIAGAPLVIPGAQRVDVSAHWSTSKSGIPALYTSPGVPNGTFVAVPRQARSLTVLAPTLAGLPTSADFATAPNAGSVIYQVAPGAFLGSQAVPVTAGARFVRFAGAAGVVFPVFQLWV